MATESGSERNQGETYDYVLFDPKFLSLNRLEELVEDTQETSNFDFIRLPRLPQKTILSVKRRLDFTAHFEAVTDPKDLANADAALARSGMKLPGRPFFVSTVLPKRREELIRQGYSEVTTSQLQS